MMNIEDKLVLCPNAQEHNGIIGWCIEYYGNCKLNKEKDYVVYEGKKYLPCYLQLHPDILWRKEK